MKKKGICLLCAIMLVVLLVPFNFAQYDDGGTIKITSLTYTIVIWSRFEIILNEDGTFSDELHENTCVYLFPNNFKKLGELWEIRH